MSWRPALVDEIVRSKNYVGLLFRFDSNNVGIVWSCSEVWIATFFKLDDSCCDPAGIPKHVKDLLQGHAGEPVGATKSFPESGILLSKSLFLENPINYRWDGMSIINQS